MIAFENVFFSYNPGTPFEKKVFENLSFSFPENTLNFVLGMNGCGKSTLLQLCASLLIPQSGNVTIDGQTTKKRSALRVIRQTVSVLFQYPERFFFGPTIRDELCLPLKNWHIPEKEWDAKVNRALLATGLSESFLNRSPFTLSGGEMRMAALAGLMMTDPTYILMDEPTAGLDYHGKIRVLKIIRNFVLSGKTCVIVTHDLQFGFDLSLENQLFWLLQDKKKPIKRTLTQLIEEANIEEHYGLLLPSLIEYERLKEKWKQSQVSS
jgi:energy-coupling factor transport system ATP-binding protein